jgi:aminopeptidase
MITNINQQTNIIHDHFEQRLYTLNNKNYTALRFFNAVTDLTVGLSNEHCWFPGVDSTEANIANEVWTLADCCRIQGHVRGSQQVLLEGYYLKQWELRFENGYMMDFSSTLSSDFTPIDVRQKAGIVSLLPKSLEPASSKPANINSHLVISEFLGYHDLVIDLGGLDVNAIKPDGIAETVMRAGQWVLMNTVVPEGSD